MDFKRADIDSAVDHAIKSWSALIVERWRSKVWIARINHRAPGVRAVRKSRSAVVLQGTKNWICIDLIARAGQIAAGVVAAEVVAK